MSIWPTKPYHCWLLAEMNENSVVGKPNYNH